MHKLHKLYFLSDPEVLLYPSQLMKLVEDTNPNPESPLIIFQIETWFGEPISITKTYITGSYIPTEKSGRNVACFSIIEQE